jgi:hypothetical protein
MHSRHAARLEEWGTRRSFSLPAAARCVCGGRVAAGYGGGLWARPVPTKLLIVAEDKDADPAGLTFAPLFIGRELQARFGTIAEVL